MKLRTLFLPLCCLLLSASAQAGRVIRDSIFSDKLQAMRHFTVYLPDAYGHTDGEPLPVLYLLHGLTGDDQDWTRLGQMERVCDQLMASGEAKPMVVVMPEAGGQDIHKVWNGYFNMPQWPYEDFFFEELLPAAEANYKCGGDRKRRAVAGLSMGGGGSAVYAERHPDLFAACYAMSAWLSNNGRLLRKATTDPADRYPPLTEAVDRLDALRFLEEAAPETLEKLRKVAWFVDCGDDDFLLEQNLKFYGLLRTKRIAAELRVRDGGHSWEYWHSALQLCLPFVSRNF